MPKFYQKKYERRDKVYCDPRKIRHAVHQFLASNNAEASGLEGEPIRLTVLVDGEAVDCYIEEMSFNREHGLFMVVSNMQTEFYHAHLDSGPASEAIWRFDQFVYGLFDDDGNIAHPGDDTRYLTFTPARF